MYVCTCHGIRRRDVDSAMDAGAGTPRAVLDCCGVKPQCGRCLREILGYIRERKAAGVLREADPALAPT